MPVPLVPQRVSLHLQTCHNRCPVHHTTLHEASRGNPSAKEDEAPRFSCMVKAKGTMCWTISNPIAFEGSQSKVLATSIPGEDQDSPLLITDPEMQRQPFTSDFVGHQWVRLSGSKIAWDPRHRELGRTRISASPSATATASILIAE